MRHFGPTAILGAVLAVATPAAFAQPATEAVLDTYADVARAGYEDSLATARSLSAAIDALIAAPTADTLAAAREAWRAARIPYQQTEAFRFGNAIVDDWEGKVNAWPLDEGRSTMSTRPMAPNPTRTLSTPPMSSPTRNSPSTARPSTPPRSPGS